MQYHELTEIFQPVNNDGVDFLCDSIEKQGQIIPIYLFEDKILDGRARFEACGLIGMTPSYKRYVGDSPVSFIMALNFHRRQMTENQAMDSLRKKCKIEHDYLCDSKSESQTKKHKNIDEKKFKRHKMILLECNDLITDHKTRIERVRALLAREKENQSLIDELDCVILSESYQKWGD